MILELLIFDIEYVTNKHTLDYVVNFRINVTSMSTIKTKSIPTIIVYRVDFDLDF